MKITRSSILPIVCVALAHSAVVAQSLLVVNQGDADVRVVEPASGRQIADIRENTSGVHGHEIVADGRTAFLPIYGSSGVGKPGIDGRQVLVLDLPTRKIVGSIDFDHGVRPHDPVLDPGGHLLYVTTELDNSVTIIDPHTRKIVGVVPTGQSQSHMLVLAHDGKLGYTANVGPGTVSVLDLVHRKTLAVIPVSARVQRISISPDDKLVFTSDQTRPRLAVIDTSTRRVRNWVPLPGLGYGSAPTPDGRWLLVAIPSSSLMAVVDLTTMRVARQIAVPNGPAEVLVRPDAKVAYVSCAAGNKVVAIDLQRWTVQNEIEAGRYPDGLAWAR